MFVLASVYSANEVAVACLICWVCGVCGGVHLGRFLDLFRRDE